MLSWAYKDGVTQPSPSDTYFKQLSASLSVFAPILARACLMPCVDIEVLLWAGWVSAVTCTGVRLGHTSVYQGPVSSPAPGGRPGVRTGLASVFPRSDIVEMSLDS